MSNCLHIRCEPYPDCVIGAAAEPPTCGRCNRPFDPADLRFDGQAEAGNTGFCRGCVDRCHEAGSDHRCVVCCAHDHKVDSTQLGDPMLTESCNECGAEWSIPRGDAPGGGDATDG